MLPIIEPTIDALTTLLGPFESAITAMISSAALPNVAFNNPPAPSPIRVANASVARPIHPASGIMPMAEQMKSAVGFSTPGQNRNAIAIGTNKTSPVKVGFNFTMNSDRIAHAPGLRTSCLCTDGDTSATAKGSQRGMPRRRILPTFRIA